MSTIRPCSGQPVVSIVIPVFNGAESLRRAVESALMQDLPLEVLIVDDRSSDDSLALAHRLAAHDRRVRVLANTVNGGPGASRNAGFAAARGVWLATLDADDAYAPDRLTQMVRVGERHQADAVADNLVLYDWAAQSPAGTALALPRGAVRRVMPCDYAAGSVTGRSAFDYGQLKPIFRRSFLETRGLAYPAGLRHGEDFALAMDCLLADAHFLLMGEALYLFTQRIGPLSAAVSGQSRTTMDFEAMRRQTLALLGRPRVRRDVALSALLRKRAAAIRYQASWNRAYPYLRARRPLGLMGELARDWRTWPMLVRHFARRRSARARLAGSP